MSHENADYKQKFFLQSSNTILSKISSHHETRHTTRGGGDQVPLARWSNTGQLSADEAGAGSNVVGNTTGGVQTLPAQSRATTFSSGGEGRAVHAKSESGAEGRVRRRRRRRRRRSARGGRVREDSCPRRGFGARRRGRGVWGVANYLSTLPPLKLIKLVIFGEAPRGTTNHCKRAHIHKPLKIRKKLCTSSVLFHEKCNSIFSYKLAPVLVKKFSYPRLLTTCC